MDRQRCLGADLCGLLMRTVLLVALGICLGGLALYVGLGVIHLIQHAWADHLLLHDVVKYLNEHKPTP